MSAGYGPPAVNTFGMIAGLGQAFGDSYDAARKRSQEDDAPELFGKLLGVQSAPASAPAITMGTLGQAAPSTPSAPTFATSGGAIGDYLKTTRAVESGGNDLAANPNSSAKGRYQFTDSTWRSVAKAHPELGLQPGGWKDPAQQEKAMQAFTSDNAGILSGKGIPINPGNLYVAHFLGAGGATKFIPGAINSPDAPATAFVSPGAARANRSIFFNRDGSPKTAGEVYAERTGRFVSREPVATPALPAGGPVAGVPSMMSAGAPATMPVSRARPTGARVPTFLGSQAQGGFDPNALPAAPTAVASAQASPDADMPVAGAQPAQFQIPGQPAPAAAPAAAPVAQGFPGMGGGTSRISPEQAEILKQAWRNPNTRAMATSVYQSILQGKDSPWTLQDVNGQSAWVNKQTQAIVPVGQAKRQTATVGNVIVDLATGQPIYSAPDKDENKLQSVAPGTTLYDPRARAPVFTAPEREEAYNLGPGQQRMRGDKVVASLPDRDKSTEAEAKLRTEFTKQLGTFGEVQDGYRRLIAATEQREANPNSVSPASDIGLIFGYMKMLDPGSVVREGEYATAQNAAGIDDRLRNTYNKIIKGEFLTPQQRQDFVDTAGRLYGQARQGADTTANRYRGLAKEYGLDEGRVVALPDPLAGPKVNQKKAEATPAKEAPKFGSVSVPMKAVGALRANPTMRADFDAKYGAGASDRILGKAKD